MRLTYGLQAFFIVLYNRIGTGFKCDGRTALQPTNAVLLGAYLKVNKTGGVDGGRHHEQVAERLLAAPQRVLVHLSHLERVLVDHAPLAELHVERVRSPVKEVEGDDDAQGLVDAVRGLDVL